MGLTSSTLYVNLLSSQAKLSDGWHLTLNYTVDLVFQVPRSKTKLPMIILEA